MNLIEEAVAKLSAGRASEAEALCRRELTRDARNVNARAILAVALAAQRRHSESVALMRELHAEQPDELSHALNLGNALREAGQLDEAIERLRAALVRWPDETDLQFNLALALFARAHWRDAADLFARLYQRAPGPIAAGVYLARCLAELGQQQQAIALARRLEPAARNPGLLNELGIALHHVGDDEASLRVLGAAIALDPTLVEARANRADVLERANREVEARTEIEAMGDAVERLPQARMVRARLLRREGKVEEAIRDLRALTMDDASPRAASDALFDLGKLLDGAGRYDEAYAALARANALIVEYWRGQRDRLASRPEELPWLNDRFDPAWVTSWTRPAVPPDPQSPVFVVGFPRSGSTLFEQILDAHPQLQALEEKPAVEAMVTRLRNRPADYPASLAHLTAQTIAELRAVYWAEVARHLERTPGTRLVDKYPLNMTRLAVIQRVFPEAGFLLLLRHPCDVVFSCFMQNFRITDGTVGFHSLESTARIYARVMENWVNEAAVFNPRHLVVRYEDLVRDLEREVRRVVGFLGLELDARMLDPAAHARSRGRINTPSYSQVVRPVNADAIERWRRYERHFEPVLPILEPWIRRWGYQD
jgi:tetratricopeptide (TPR) repeat protein